MEEKRCVIFLTSSERIIEGKKRNGVSSKGLLAIKIIRPEEVFPRMNRKRVSSKESLFRSKVNGSIRPRWEIGRSEAIIRRFDLSGENLKESIVKNLGKHLKTNRRTVRAKVTKKRAFLNGSFVSF